MINNIDLIIKDIEFVYYKFRKISSEFNNRPYKLPKNFKKHLYNRMSENNRSNLINITQNFLTKWERIDIEDYFRIGFKLFKKGFSYNKFLDKRIIENYKDVDKNKKRDIQNNKKKFIKSVYFVKKYIKDNNISLEKYLKKIDNNIHLVIKHYLSNKVDKIFIIFLIKKGFFYLNDSEKVLVPYILENYRYLYVKLDEMKDFVIKVERMLK